MKRSDGVQDAAQVLQEARELDEQQSVAPAKLESSEVFEARLQHPQVVRIERFDADGLHVVVPGEQAARPARTTLSMDAGQWRALAEQRAEALCTFEAGHKALPIVTGVLQAVPDPESQPPEEQQTGADLLDARLDGDRVVLSAEREIELRCGEASIVLRRNGRMVLRGAYLETRATGVNRIRGGVVRIN